MKYRLAYAVAIAVILIGCRHVEAPEAYRIIAKQQSPMTDTSPPRWDLVVQRPNVNERVILSVPYDTWCKRRVSEYVSLDGGKVPKPPPQDKWK